MQSCSATLFGRPEALREMSTARLARYLNRCFSRGKAMMYVSNSLYAPCILHALRWFRKEQFLFVKYEDLVGFNTRQIVEMAGAFFGMHVDEGVLRLAERHGSCDPASSGRQRSFTSRSPIAPTELGEVVPLLESVFAPYSAMLRELLGPAFTWSPAQHKLPPVSATERAAREAFLDEIVKKRRARFEREREERARRIRAIQMERHRVTGFNQRRPQPGR